MFKRFFFWPKSSNWSELIELKMGYVQIENPNSSLPVFYSEIGGRETLDYSSSYYAPGNFTL